MKYLYSQTYDGVKLELHLCDWSEIKINKMTRAMWSTTNMGMLFCDDDISTINKSLLFMNFITEHELTTYAYDDFYYVVRNELPIYFRNLEGLKRGDKIDQILNEATF